ncbi:MAG: serine/threonine-protein kinase [Acidobacteriota bacterium]
MSVSQEKFILQEKLNESATTLVYKAYQSALGRTVLLKILHRHLAGDARLVERFRREARACALVRSEYIVQVFDLTEIDGAPAIVMEFVEGPSLKDVLAREGALDAGRTLAIGFEALNALAAAHVRGVIHRDIKPGNMLLAESGQIKVTDFGLAAVEASPTVTMEGAVLGTPAYLPPEHIRGEAADERSDLFSLGATLLEAHTGKRIFEGPTYSACITNILRFDPSVIDTLVADRRLAALIRRLMEPDRSLRFQSAREALDLYWPKESSAQPPMQAEEASVEAPQSVPRAPAVAGTRSRTLIAAVIAITVITIAVVLVRLPLRKDAPPTAGKSGSDAALMAPDTLAPERKMAALAETAQGDRDHLPSAVQREEPAAGEAAAKMTPAVRASRDSANLSVTCIPWAKVFVDSQYLGETPIGGTVRIASGTHTVSFTNPQFTPIVRSVTAQPGAELTVSGNFFETAGYILITVRPWAEVYIDDQYRDTTPIDKPLPVSAGRRRIRLHNPGFTDAVYDVVISRADTLRLSYSLTRNK